MPVCCAKGRRGVVASAKLCNTRCGKIMRWVCNRPSGHAGPHGVTGGKEIRRQRLAFERGEQIEKARDVRVQVVHFFDSWVGGVYRVRCGLVRGVPMSHTIDPNRVTCKNCRHAGSLDVPKNRRLRGGR